MIVGNSYGLDCPRTRRKPTSGVLTRRVSLSFTSTTPAPICSRFLEFVAGANPDCWRIRSQVVSSRRGPGGPEKNDREQKPNWNAR